MEVENQEDQNEEIAATEPTTSAWSQLHGVPHSFRTRCSAVSEYVDTEDVSNNFLKGETFRL